MLLRVYIYYKQNKNHGTFFFTPPFAPPLIVAMNRVSQPALRLSKFPYIFAVFGVFSMVLVLQAPQVLPCRDGRGYTLGIQYWITGPYVSHNIGRPIPPATVLREEIMTKMYLIPGKKNHEWVTLAVVEDEPILSATKPPITGPIAEPRECGPSAGNATGRGEEGDVTGDGGGERHWPSQCDRLTWTQVGTVLEGSNPAGADWQGGSEKKD
jgi:hypothetical protein